ncbi:MAG: Sec-independent protein translocase protein TatB [Pseudoxanthomonas sp.]
MFDIGFGELIMIGIVALVVLGPERLPKAARFAGLWMRRARNQWDSVKQELERELAAEELKRSLHDTRQALDEAGRQVRDVQAEMAQRDQQARAQFEQLSQSTQLGRPPALSDEPAPAAPQAAAIGAAATVADTEVAETQAAAPVDAAPTEPADADRR